MNNRKDFHFRVLHRIYEILYYKIFIKIFPNFNSNRTITSHLLAIK